MVKMGGANQTSSNHDPKGRHKSRKPKSSKTTWWVMKKKKKELFKKRPEVAGNDTQRVLNDQTASLKVGMHIEKKSASKAQVARPSEPGKPMSKQARKRRLKRQERTSKTLERKKNLNGNVTIAKDKGMDRTDKQLKKRKRRFKKKKVKATTNQVEDGDDKNVETERGMKVSSEGGGGEDNTSDGDQEKDDKTLSRKRNRKNANLLGSAKKAKKGVKAGAVTVHTSGDKSGDAELPDIDSNWRDLMKSINYQPLEKKRELAKAKDSKPEIWFDDVDPELMEEESTQRLSVDLSKIDPMHHGKGNPSLLGKGSASPGLTKYVGLDCEMVGIGLGGKENMLARVSIVNQYGLCIYDKFVAPQEEVTNFRNEVTGIRAKDLKNADNFPAVQDEVSSILKGRILVGHALHNDLKVLLLTHPKAMIRDTSTYKKFKDLSKGKKPKLKKLSEMILKVPIQEAEHDSVQDAQAAMKLFMLHRVNWEKELGKQCRRKLKIKTNQEAELLISTPSSVPDTEH